MKRILVAVLLLVCLTGCAAPSEKSQLPSETDTTAEPSVGTTAPIETAVPVETDPLTAMYQDLVDDFRAITEYCASAEFDSEALDSACFSKLSKTMQKIFSQDDDSRSLLDALVWELPMTDQPKLPTNYGYILHDLNADGIPELFWVRQDHSILAIFTRKNEQMILLDGFFSRYYGYVSSNNMLYCYGADGAADHDCTIYTISGGEKKALFRFGMESTDGIRYFEGSGKESIDISDDRLQALMEKFPERISQFWRSMTVFSLDREVLPEEVDGSNAAKPSVGSKRIPFLQKVRRIDQALYQGPGYEYPWLGNIGKEGTFTIMAVVPDENGQDWGKLKSGDGWVNLTQLQEEEENKPLVTAAYVDGRLLQNGSYAHKVVSTDEYTQQMAICAHKDIRDIEFYEMDISESNVAVELLFTVEKIPSGKFVLVDISFPGDMTTYGMRLVDGNGKIHDYLLMESGYEGAGGFAMWEEDFMVQITGES